MTLMNIKHPIFYIIGTQNWCRTKLDSARKLYAIKYASRIQRHVY